MKNILIITDQPHSYIGGVETYNYKLITILSKFYNVYEYAYVEHDYSKIVRKNILSKDRMSKIDKNISKQYIDHFNYGSIKRLIKNIAVTRKIKRNFDDQLIKWNSSGIKFDAYIDTSNIFFDCIDYSKVIFCQHFDNSLYINKGVKSKIAYMIKCIFNVHRKSFNYAKRIVTLNLDSKFLNFDNVVNIVYSEPSYVTLNNFVMRDDICFVGRLSIAKGANEMKAISKLLGVEIHVYGSYDENIKMCETMLYKGLLKNDEVAKIFTKYKMSILLSSHHEGLPLSILDSLNAGTPIITLKNKWYNEKFLNSDNVGISIDEKCDLNEYVKQIKNILNSENTWSPMSVNCKNKYNNITREKFDDLWLAEIKSLIN